ncbi:hypothetical protein [Lysinibacillus sp. NPDC047702]|uniref:hypothetical protein n=1 Tax=unclassified Lysinibacillus TaxID=2636778 RepID=UPI003D08C3F4
MFQIDGRGEKPCRKKLPIHSPQPEINAIRQHEQSYISTKLTQEQIKKMMRVIDEIRLRRHEDIL